MEKFCKHNSKRDETKGSLFSQVHLFSGHCHAALNMLVLMILFNVTHPPAGGNPIIVIIGSVSIEYLLNPIITGSIIILIFAIVLNRLILKKDYPK